MTSPKLKIVLFFLVVVVLTNSCLKDDELNQSFDSYEPINLEDGLVLSNPEDENMDTGLLTDIYADIYKDDDLWSLRSLLIFRNGKLVAESYLKDKSDISNRHIIWSCTKQVMGVLTGIAIDKGIITDIDDPISNYFDGELTNHSDKADITVRNLITMQSGIDYSNEDETDEILQNKPENSIDFVLSQPNFSSPGTNFKYSDGNPHLISGLIQKMTGKPTDEWADEVLFSKIEMTNYNWVRYKDGVALGGFGIETTPRELAKIALCVAENGEWKGEQVISPNWIEKMTDRQVVIDNSDLDFGYFWWIDSTKNIYFMWGSGGQFGFIIPDKNLVVVMTSIPSTKGEYEIDSDEALALVEKIIDTAL